MKKINVLFVTSEFWNGGSQRLLFEINKSISRDKFETSILSLRDLNSSPEWEDVYYNKHVELNSNIFFLNHINKLTHYTLKERIYKKLFGIQLKNERQPLLDFLNAFDFLIFMGEYTFPILERFLTEEIKSKSFISIVFSRYQEPNNFIKYDKTYNYKFISGFTNEEIKYELAEFKNYSHYFLPLSISVNDNKVKWKPKKTRHKKIGIFTRLTNAKPLDVFLFALHLINDNNIILNIYGTGNPEDFGLRRIISYLSIDKIVFFKGHQENLTKTAIDDNLDLVWFHGYYETPGGFASFDLSSIGIPQIFWNFTPDVDSPTQNIFPMFTNLKEFVNCSCDLLQNTQLSEELGSKQFEYISTHRNMVNNIKLLENILLQHPFDHSCYN